mmetsp:Transcript_130577/g.279192  ORF Transcript_130577/g.279192 Transcript_130577/m.279192 type:complete len:102 (-) Transcript_130577:251-556(-)
MPALLFDPEPRLEGGQQGSKAYQWLTKSSTANISSTVGPSRFHVLANGTDQNLSAHNFDPLLRAQLEHVLRTRFGRQAHQNLNTLVHLLNQRNAVGIRHAV